MSKFTETTAGKLLRSLYAGRLPVLMLVLAIFAGTLLGLPVQAVEEAADLDAESEAVGAELCNLQLHRRNLRALETAELTAVGEYAGTLSPLYNVTVIADGESTVLCMSQGDMVTDAVTTAGVTLGKADRLNHEKDRFVQDGLTVQVTRVTYREYQKTFSIAYTTEVKYTSALRQGATKVVQKGVSGVRTVTYRDHLEDGKVVDTKTVKEEITKQPVKKIVWKGTKVGKVVSEAPFDIPLDSAGQPLSYKKKLSGKATAYTSDRGDSGTHTSCGYRAQVGIVAVNPSLIPYGTKLWIVSADGKTVYGYAIAGDTGGSVRSGRTLVDLYFDTYGECTRFGRRTMNVYIL